MTSISSTDQIKVNSAPIEVVPVPKPEKKMSTTDGKLASIAGTVGLAYGFGLGIAVTKFGCLGSLGAIGLFFARPGMAIGLPVGMATAALARNIFSYFADPSPYSLEVLPFCLGAYIADKAAAPFDYVLKAITVVAEAKKNKTVDTKKEEAVDTVAEKSNQ